MTKVAIVYHSGYGHTAVLADSVAQGVHDGGAQATLLKVEAFDQDFEPLFDQIADADAVVFGAPTYMGDVSAGFKAFEEASAKKWYAQAWKDKLAAGFTVSGSLSGDKLQTLSSIAVFAAQHSMVWVSTGQLPGNASGKTAPEDVNRLGSSLGVMAQADNGPAEVTPPSGDRETARLLGQRVAEHALRWRLGAAAQDTGDQRQAA
jgi:NAD(P)H dehydrogenase (quinone)